MLRTGVGEVGETAMVHGTAAGVECGRRAGASVVVGVLTGPHPAARLHKAGATHVIKTIAQLPGVLARGRARDGAAAGDARVRPAYPASRKLSSVTHLLISGSMAGSVR